MSCDVNVLIHYLTFIWYLWPYNMVLAGTGSGVGTRILEILKDEYPDVYRYFNPLVMGVRFHTLGRTTALVRGNCMYS